MRLEYWSDHFQEWRESEMSWTPEQIAEINGTVGWEMYREAE